MSKKQRRIIMKKKLMVIAVAAVLALSGCLGESSASEQTSDTDEASAVDETERYNAYIDMNNIILDDIDYVVYSYFYSAMYQQDFALYDEDNYWCTYLPEDYFDFMDYVYGIAEAAEPGDDIDNAYIELYPVMKELCEKVNEVFDYIDAEGYLEDDYAKAKELHTVIYSDFNSYIELSGAFIDSVSEMAEAQIAEDMDYFQSEGFEVLYSMNSLLLTAKEIQSAIYDQEIYDENIIDLDLSAIQPLYDEYVAEIDTCMGVLASEDKLANDGFSADNPYLESFKTAVSSSEEALDGIFERVQAQEPIEDYYTAEGTVSQFDSAVSYMIDYYNAAIDY